MESTPTRVPPAVSDTPLPYRPPPPPSPRRRLFTKASSALTPPPSPTLKRGPRLSRVQEVAFAARELYRGASDDVHHEYVGSERRVRYLLATYLGPKYQRQLRIGRLHVRLIEAANLHAADLGGTSDPYVVATLTGWNKYGDEWDDRYGWRATERSRVQTKTLSPRWYEDKYFAVPRHDAWLRVEVFDRDNQSTDDLLGSVEIPLRDLSHVGALKRWFPLAVPNGGDHSAAIHLYLHYDVSALGEALSILWAEAPRDRSGGVFDANLFYANAMALQKELKPYLAFASNFEKVLAWKSPGTKRCFLLALLAAWFAEYAWELVHFTIIFLLLRNLKRKRVRERVRWEAKKCFASVDSDGGGTLDRAEIGLAIGQLAAKRRATPPSAAEVDKLFKAADIDKGGSLDLDEFAQLCVDSPSLMGLDAPEEEDEDEVVGDEETERLLRGSPQQKKLFSATHRDVREPASKGPFKGMTKKVVNLAATKAGRAPAKFMLKLGIYAKDVRQLRDVFEWAKPKTTAAFLAANLGAIVYHWYLPIRCFAIPVVLGMFFVLSENAKALERVASKAFAARRRYVQLSRLKSGRDMPSSPLLSLSTACPVPPQRTSRLPSFGRGHNKSLVKSVVRGIFSRLDDDASGSVDGRELIRFVAAALPRATPRARAVLGGAAAAAAVERLVRKFDVNGAARRPTRHHRAAREDTPAGDGQIDRGEFECIVQHSGCVEVLTQDELRRQLALAGGLHCSKRPSHTAHFPMTASHTTSLTIEATRKKVGDYRIHRLVWTTVKGARRAADDVKRVAPSSTAPSVLLVHRASPPPLQFDVGLFFRDPLVDLLTMLCTGAPLAGGPAQDPARIDDLAATALRLAEYGSDGELGEDI